VGADGTLFIVDPWKATVPGIRLLRGGSEETIQAPAADPYTSELDDFAAAVRGEISPPFGRDDAVAQARTIAALYASADSGDDVDV
jgi:predicted dehydrogenase